MAPPPIQDCTQHSVNNETMWGYAMLEEFGVGSVVRGGTKNFEGSSILELNVA